MSRGEPLIRQWNLLKAMQAYHYGLCADDLALRLECSKRQVQRDLKVLQEVGFPVFAEFERPAGEVTSAAARNSSPCLIRFSSSWKSERARSTKSGTASSTGSPAGSGANDRETGAVPPLPRVAATPLTVIEQVTAP